MTQEERKNLSWEKKFSFNCNENNRHIESDCKVKVQCDICGKSHSTSMQRENQSFIIQNFNGGEHHLNAKNITSRCTTLCGDNGIGKSSRKTVLVDIYPSGQENKAVRVYAITGNQSNLNLTTKDC